MNLLKPQGNSTSRAEPNLTDRITEVLANEITSGNYKLGEVLPPEQTIADRLGVSRTVLREAVSRLKADGLVSSKQGRGLAVQAVARPSVLRMHAADEDNLDEILAIVELRRGFEIEAASLAAARHNDDDLQAMRKALDDMARAIESDDIAAGIEADLRFHRAIAEATRNEHYVEFFHFLSRLLRDNLRVSRTRSAKAKRGTDAQREHEIIYQAIQRGDPELARQCARNHIENTESRLRSSSHFTSGALK
ncbi:FadR/GntR family transcriptional regulator [Parapusillimonas granuli]|uniref:FadR family transcriptional regulator n=1 Tax=Parapusillimonas granuli TaxID=380911 RepID=A0A853G0G9_9BURK|nr:FadR/GntR family transcriptional regulator [Parapusillimonas granuli]MBB5215516.1 DNA-binding FadR family transcriptional regulator [Parapusillimonas granuli]MEB2400359.1 FadR/GntR family transcriptional regulator [Alcaligenaceae bacterium]NYT49817.1 FadR family transcriptional regulator [Parapusillimonas granuli]